MASPRDFVFDDQGEMLPSDSAAAAARRKELGTTPKPPTRPGQQVSGAKPVASKTKPAAKAKPAIVTKEELAKSGFTNLRDYLNDQKKLKRRDGKAPEKAKPSTPAAKASEDNRPKASGAMIQSMDTDMMRNLSRKEARFQGAKRMAKTPEGQAKRKEQERGQAIKRVTPEEYIGPSAGLKLLQKAAAKFAKPKVREYNPTMLPAPKAASKTDTKALPASRERLSYDKRGMKDKERAQRAADREKQKDSDNIQRGGRLTGGRDIELKKGGKVCMASKRADGIAVKGKTRGTVY